MTLGPLNLIQSRTRAVAEDCGVGASKKACANCSCGRAEAEAAGVKTALTLEMLENPQSACGSVRAPRAPLQRDTGGRMCLHSVSCLPAHYPKAEAMQTAC